jgi:outer membrane protein assembly factor BamD (BamD/ComL family)
MNKRDFDIHTREMRNTRHTAFPIVRLLAMMLVLVLALTGGCAYFNAFYLARKNYNDAEHLRSLQKTEVLSADTIDRYNTSINWAREVIREYPDSRYVDDSYYYTALAFYRLGDYVSSRSRLEDLLEIFPDSDYASEATYWLAMSHIGVSRYEDARLLLDELRDSDDRGLQGRAGIALADIARRNEQWELLLEIAGEVVAANVDRDQRNRAEVFRAEALFELERPDESIKVLEDAAGNKMEPGLRFLANTLLARAIASQERYDDALGYLAEMASRGEFAEYDSKIRLEIGKIHEMRDDIDLAIETFENLAGDYPDSLQAKEAWFRVGDIIIRDLDQAEDARRAFDMVSKGGARSVDVRYEVDALLRVSQIDSMLAKIERIEAIDTPEERAHTRYTLAELYTHSFDRPDSSLSQYQRILDESPHSEYAVIGTYFLSRQALEEDGEFTEQDALDIMDDIETRYPASDYTQKLKVHLGLITDTPAEEQYKKAEVARLGGAAPEEYVPIYQSVVDDYPGTDTAFKAQLATAYFTEHDLGELDTALDLYRALGGEDPTFVNLEYVMTAREKLDYYRREDEQKAEIQRYLDGFEAAPGTTVVTNTLPGVEADPMAGFYSHRKIRARNARIRDRNFEN